MSKTYPFEVDELFQLNLLLWLVWSSRASGIKPIFREDGFELMAIGPSLKPTLRVFALASEGKVSFKTQAKPDILLRHNSQLLFLPIECKLNSFGPDSDTADQANVLLTVRGLDIASSSGLPKAERWKSFLIYTLSKNTEKMKDTLDTLSGRIEAVGLSAVPSGTISITISSDGVYLHALPCTDFPVSSLNSLDPSFSVRVMELDEGDDPRPFYLIPVDPSVTLNNPLGIRLLEERIRVATVSVFGSRLDSAEFEVSEDEFMSEVLEIWDYWKDKSARTGLLRQASRPYLNKILQEMRNRGAKITQKQRIFRFSGITSTVAKNIRSYLTSTSFRKGDVNFVENLKQLSFEDLPEGWVIE